MSAFDCGRLFARLSCDDSQHDICDELELYARRCFESGLCLSWRSEELCGRDDSCPPTTEYRQCTGTCMKSCEKQDCPRLEMDGCFCPDGQVGHGCQTVGAGWRAVAIIADPRRYWAALLDDASSCM